MHKQAPVFRKNGFIMRLARVEDAEEYYAQNYCPLDPEVTRLTGCKPEFTRQEVVSFFLSCVDAEDRFDFLLIAPDGRIIGESVINEINAEAKSANFRIAIFHSRDCGKGIGSWMIRETRDFAFRELKLHRLYLDVFSFNPRAEHAYLKAGFKREGVLRDAVRNSEGYADDILMSILEDEWRSLKAAEDS